MLTILVFALSLLATASALGWLYILLHPACPWDFQPVGDDRELKLVAPAAEYPAVAIVVPARNEAESLPQTLPALLAQDYPGSLHVILVSDRSTDDTANVARKLGALGGARLTVIEGAQLPEGWMGKVWAMTQGAQAAMALGVEYILLTDADILHAPQSLRRLVSESHAQSLGLNSRMARLRCESFAEKLLIPAFVHFFGILYPMRRVNNPRDPLASAAGGCALLSAEAFKRMGETFESIRHEIIDDVNLARQVKGHGLPIRLSLSRAEVLSLREYPRLADIWKMVRRTAFTELRYSWLRLLGALAGLALLFVIPLLTQFVCLLGAFLGVPLTFCAWGLLKGSVALAIMGHVYAPAMRFFKLPLWRSFTLPLAAVLYGAMTFDSALRHARGVGIQWREAVTKPPNVCTPAASSSRTSD